MLLKEIGKLCKQRALIHMVRFDPENTEQWIGDGSSLYHVGGMHIGDVGDLLSIFDYDEKTREHTMTREEQDCATIELSDEADEIPATLSRVTVKLGSTELVPVYAGGSMLLINAKYLSPLKDLKEPTYCVRANGSAQYLTAKDGMFAAAHIFPTHPVNNELRDELNRIAVLMENVDKSDEQCGMEDIGEEEEDEE